MEKTQKISTRAAAQQGFVPHGAIDIWREGRLLLYEATGPFNVELVNALALAQRDALTNFTFPTPWASVGILRESMMMSLEVVDRYLELMKTPRPAAWTPVVTAFAIGLDVEGRSIVSRYFERVYREIARPMRIFETVDDAKAWALEQTPCTKD